MTVDPDVLAPRDPIAIPSDEAEYTATLRAQFGTSIAIKSAMLDGLDAAARVAALLVDAYRTGHKLIVFGNGGSAADAQHIAAEFVGKLYIRRRPLPALSLTVNTSVMTAIGNDYGFEGVYERQVEAFADPGDVVIGISTSGNAENVIRGVRAARLRNVATVGMTGQSGGRLRGEVDHLVSVPSDDTPRIQEVHILVGHIWSEIVEAALFGHGAT
jgi:D-sedoheptulose 7-phosphate isomerase